MGFLAVVKNVGSGGLVYIEPVSATDPGYGMGGVPVDPDYGMGTLPHPGQGLPGYGHPDQGLPGYGHPDHNLPNAPVRPSPPIVVPYPPEIQPPPERPIVVPKPTLPPGSMLAVPLPIHVPVPTPPTGTPPEAKPYVVWGGPGTDSKLVYMVPPVPGTPK